MSKAIIAVPLFGIAMPVSRYDVVSSAFLPGGRIREESVALLIKSCSSVDSKFHSSPNNSTGCLFGKVSSLKFKRIKGAF
jgi:hypothetical protein